MITASQTTFAALGAAQPIKKLKSIRFARVPRESRRSRIRARGGNSEVTAASILNSSAQPTATVEVDLGDRSYPIYIGSSLLDNGELIRRHIPGNTALVVTRMRPSPHFILTVQLPRSQKAEIFVSRSSFCRTVRSTKTWMC